MIQGRGERMTTLAIGIFLDYSKNLVTEETLKLLLQLAEESGLRRIDAMFQGEKINITEGRAVLHVPRRHALRCINHRRWPERGASGPRRAREDDRLLQPDPSGTWKGHTGNAIATSSISGSAGRTWGP